MLRKNRGFTVRGAADCALYGRPVIKFVQCNRAYSALHNVFAVVFGRTALSRNRFSLAARVGTRLE
jgi:hypothetical protein